MLTTGYASDAKWNDTHFKSEHFDEILKAARSELDTKKRRNMYAQLQRIIRDDGGTIVPMFKDFVGAASSKVKFDKLSGNLEADGSRAPERWWFA